jgi:hypothetical protein
MVILAMCFSVRGIQHVVFMGAQMEFLGAKDGKCAVMIAMQREMQLTVDWPFVEVLVDSLGYFVLQYFAQPAWSQRLFIPNPGEVPVIALIAHLSQYAGQVVSGLARHLVVCSFLGEARLRRPNAEKKSDSYAQPRHNGH